MLSKDLRQLKQCILRWVQQNVSTLLALLPQIMAADQNVRLGSIPWTHTQCIPLIAMIHTQEPYPKMTTYDNLHLPIGSMYAIYGNIYHQYTPFLLAYIPAPWILWVCDPQVFHVQSRYVQIYLMKGFWLQFSITGITTLDLLWLLVQDLRTKGLQQVSEEFLPSELQVGWKLEGNGKEMSRT